MSAIFFMVSIISRLKAPTDGGYEAPRAFTGSTVVTLIWARPTEASAFRMLFVAAGTFETNGPGMTLLPMGIHCNETSFL
ncbi:hypothetical protein V6N13_059489 [Hibiscus sabdariffa]|uniref:Secreted protein n=1 Tax=Hibiscus sabdariffa TaxID=183260 RepID=A0ABR2GCX7_9ROSI